MVWIQLFRSVKSYKQIYLFGRIQTGGWPYSDTSPYKVKTVLTHYSHPLSVHQICLSSWAGARSSCYGRILMFQRLWVRILDGHFPHTLDVKIVMFVWKDEKEAEDGPFKNSVSFTPPSCKLLLMHQTCFPWERERIQNGIFSNKF